MQTVIIVATCGSKKLPARNRHQFDVSAARRIREPLMN